MGVFQSVSARPRALLLGLLVTGTSLGSFATAALPEYESNTIDPIDGFQFMAFGAELEGEDGTLLVGIGSNNYNIHRGGSVVVYEGAGLSWTRVKELWPSHTSRWSGFGVALDLEGNTLLVGAPDLVVPNEYDGDAYVFERGPGGFSETARLSTPSSGDRWYGLSVALIGNEALVSDIPVFLDRPSAVQVFSRAGGSWAPSSRLEGPGIFGSDIAVHGETVAIGAPGGGVGPSSVYIYQRSNTAWTPVATLAPSDPAELEFGLRVALHGDTLAVTSRGLDWNHAGIVSLFERINGTWTFQQALSPPQIGPHSPYIFGASLHLEGDRLIVGSHADSTRTSWGGSAYVFTRHEGVWAETRRLLASDPVIDAGFGSSVYHDGETIIVGGPGARDASGVAVGKVYLFPACKVQLDLDEDGLGSCDEDRQGTSDAIVDTDGDALDDFVESVRNPQRAALFCNAGKSHCAYPAPTVPDVYVEMDYMGADHMASAQGFQLVVDAFANAGVKLHLDAGTARGPAYDIGGGNAIPHATYLVAAPLSDCETAFTPEWDNLKSTNMAPERGSVYHYMVWAHMLSPPCHSIRGLTREIPHSDFLVSWGAASDHGLDGERVGTFMHELGHNLGLRHGGVDDINDKPNHFSVINGAFSSGLPLNTGFRQFRLVYDFSHAPSSSLNESSLDERIGIQGPEAAKYHTILNCNGGVGALDWQITDEAASKPIDWDCDGIPGEQNITADVNGNGGYCPLATSTRFCQVLQSYSDWDKLQFDGGALGETAPHRGGPEQNAHADAFPVSPDWLKPALRCLGTDIQLDAPTLIEACAVDPHVQYHSSSRS